MTDEYDAFLRTARTAATETAAVLRAKFRGQYDYGHKADGSLVTDADRAAARTLRRVIRDRHPTHAIVGEELGRDGRSTFTWVVDPLDGTANFVTGFEHYCVSVALLEDDRPVVAAVVHPEREDTYTAVRGRGARLNGDAIAVSHTTALTEGSVLVGISPPIAADDRFLRALRRLIEADCTRGVRRLGSGACDLSLVADGTFDCFVDKHTSPWDVAAGALLVSEAGGRVTDWQGNPLAFTAGERDLHVVASNGPLHAQLRAVYRESGEATE